MPCQTGPIAAAFTGHRPAKLPWGYREEDPRCVTLKAPHPRTRWTAGLSGGLPPLPLRDGAGLRPLLLRSGAGAPGTRHPEITRGGGYSLSDAGGRLACGRAAALPAVWSHSAIWKPWCRSPIRTTCMQRRDRYMVDHSMLLIAAFDGTAGGTRYTVEYALRRGIEILDVSIPAE